jgi:hypothetical protein
MDTTDQGKRAIERTRRNVFAAAGIFTSAALTGLLWRPKSAKATPAICFLKGTRIWTPLGERKVEDLRINDLVVTSSGQAKPIKWIWKRRYAWAEELAPVRVAPSALAPNTPHRDLFLSVGHRLYLDGVLIPVVDLLNDWTITRCSAEGLRVIEYFNIKLERHSVIYAEGAACETMEAVTAVNSDDLEFEEHRRLYGEPSLPDEPVAPVIGYGRRRAMLRGRLRSAISPLIDIRTKLDIVRDDLEERAAGLRL